MPETGMPGVIAGEKLLTGKTAARSSDTDICEITLGERIGDRYVLDTWVLFWQMYIRSWIELSIP